MSELQIALVAIGCAVIVLLLGFNWWQDRRARQRMQATMPVVDKDPLFDDSADLPLTREPVWSADSPDHVTASMASPEQETELQEPDPAIEVVIEVVFQAPISGQDLAEIIQPIRSAGRKPVRVFALDTQGHLVRRLHPDMAYASLQVAVLLANRGGALNDIEWSQIWNRLQAVAEQLEATIDGPEQQDVLTAALKLDSSCAALDTQVGLTLRLNSNRAVSDVLSAAKAMGFFVFDGRLGWRGDHGMTCFTLSRADTESFDAGMASVDNLTLLLDVPRTPADPRAFGRMVEVGLELARRLGAELVDDTGREVQAGTEASIDEQLQVLFKQLEAAGLPAGSPRALRVFA